VSQVEAEPRSLRSHDVFVCIQTSLAGGAVGGGAPSVWFWVGEGSDLNTQVWVDLCHCTLHEQVFSGSGGRH
jgi:hypothetical protein